MPTWRKSNRKMCVQVRAPHLSRLAAVLHGEVGRNHGWTGNPEITREVLFSPQFVASLLSHLSNNNPSSIALKDILAGETDKLLSYPPLSLAISLSSPIKTTFFEEKPAFSSKMLLGGISLHRKGNLGEILGRKATSLHEVLPQRQSSYRI